MELTKWLFGLHILFYTQFTKPICSSPTISEMLFHPPLYEILAIFAFCYYWHRILRTGSILSITYKFILAKFTLFTIHYRLLLNIFLNPINIQIATNIRATTVIAVFIFSSLYILPILLYPYQYTRILTTSNTTLLHQ